MDDCNELASYSIFKQSNKNERGFYYFSDLSFLLTAKLTHRNRKAKKQIHITDSWFKKFVTASGTTLKKLK